VVSITPPHITSLYPWEKILLPSLIQSRASTDIFENRKALCCSVNHITLSQFCRPCLPLLQIHYPRSLCNRSTDYRMSSQSVNGPTICIYKHTYECTHTQNIQRQISEKASRNSPLNNYTSLTQHSLTCVALKHDVGLLSILCKQNRSIYNIFGIYKYSYKICLYHWFQFFLLYLRLLKYLFV